MQLNRNESQPRSLPQNAFLTTAAASSRVGLLSISERRDFRIITLSLHRAVCTGHINLAVLLARAVAILTAKVDR